MALERFSTFLGKCRISYNDKNSPYTHASMTPSGKYYVSDEDIDEFHALYSDIVSSNKIKLSILEKPMAYGPLRVDFDMKAPLEVGLKRQYTKTMIKDIIKIFQTIIKSIILEENFEPRHLWCILLEKKSPRSEEGLIKDGFHLHFPYFICDHWTQDSYIRDRATEQMKKCEIWKGTKYSTPVDKLIDMNMAGKTWIMYGSCKPKGEPYLYTDTYNENGDIMTIEELLSGSSASSSTSSSKRTITYHLPKFLSIRGHTQCVPLIKKVKDEQISKTYKKAKRTMARKRSEEQIMEDIKLIKDGHIMEMISDSRADEYATWIEIGWILFNIGEGCEDCLEMWIEFSQRTSKQNYIPGECEKQWETMTLKGKTIGSLLYIAKLDSPDAYKEWKAKQLKFVMMQCLYEAKPNEWDVAQVIYKLYKDRFKCASAKKDIWYEFRNHRWHEVDDCISLKELFATEVKDLFVSLRDSLLDSKKGDVPLDIKSKIDIQEKRCTAIITALKEVGFHKKVLTMCAILFLDSKFLKKKDENKLIFVCENGVLDFETCIFRDGRPDDYATFTCEKEYHEFSVDDDEVKEIDLFFRKVFIDDEIRTYFLNSVCAAMEGGNLTKSFLIATGETNAGKSAVFEFIAEMFGEYQIKFPRELLIVGKGNTSSGPRPELDRVRGRRLAVVQEISKTDTLNIGVLKELTGNDSFFTRGMFEKGSEVKPMFTLMMMCNEPPHIPGHDNATWERTYLVPCESRFVKAEALYLYPVPESEDEQFKMKRFHADLSFSKRFKELSPALLWMMFERYKIYKKEGRKIPEKVKATTNRYRIMNDIYREFVAQMIVQIEYPKETSEAVKVFLRASTLKTEFDSWFKINHSSYSKEKHTAPIIKHEFSKLLGPLNKKGRVEGWYGYEIVYPEDEEEKIKGGDTDKERTEKKGTDKEQSEKKAGSKEGQSEKKGDVKEKQKVGPSKPKHT